MLYFIADRNGGSSSSRIALFFLLLVFGQCSSALISWVIYKIPYWVLQYVHHTYRLDLDLKGRWRSIAWGGEQKVTLRKSCLIIAYHAYEFNFVNITLQCPKWSKLVGAKIIIVRTWFHFIIDKGDKMPLFLLVIDSTRGPHGSITNGTTS